MTTRLLLPIFMILSLAGTSSAQPPANYSFKWVRLGMTLDELREALDAELKRDRSIRFETTDVTGGMQYDLDGATAENLSVYIRQIRVGGRGRIDCLSVNGTDDEICAEYNGIGIVLSAGVVTAITISGEAETAIDLYTWARLLGSGVTGQIGMPVEEAFERFSGGGAGDVTVDSVYRLSRWHAEQGADTIGAVLEFYQTNSGRYKMRFTAEWSNPTVSARYQSFIEELFGGDRE